MFPLKPTQILQVTTRCHLKCQNCTLWGNQDYQDNQLEEHLKKQLVKKTISTLKPSTKVVHIMGGDPFMNPHLELVLAYLKSKNIHTVLWTHGIIPQDQWQTILKWCDQIALFLPCEYPNEYHDITGEYGIDTLEQTIHLLKEHRKNPIINTPVTQYNIHLLPEIYDYAYDRGLSLIFHYPKKNSFNKEKRHYIERFRKVKNVWVFRGSVPSQSACVTVPRTALCSYTQLLRNHIGHKLNIIRRKVGL